MAPRAHLGMHHVALFVRDLARARAFYVDLLGYRVEWQPDADNLYLTSGCDNLALHRARDAATLGGPGQRLDHLGVVVAEPQDVYAWEEFLRTAQVPVLMPSKKHRDGATSCYVSDPDGTAVQIICHPPLVGPLSAVRDRAAL